MSMLTRYEDRAGNPCGPSRGYEQYDSHADRSRHEEVLSDEEVQAELAARLAANRLRYPMTALDTFCAGDDRGTR